MSSELAVGMGKEICFLYATRRPMTLPVSSLKNSAKKKSESFLIIPRDVLFPRKTYLLPLDRFWGRFPWTLASDHCSWQTSVNMESISNCKEQADEDSKNDLHSYVKNGVRDVTYIPSTNPARKSLNTNSDPWYYQLLKMASSPVFQLRETQPCNCLIFTITS